MPNLPTCSRLQEKLKNPCFFEREQIDFFFNYGIMENFFLILIFIFYKGQDWRKGNQLMIV